jgi:ferredoxin
MKARVDAELCVACGACVDISPEVFDLPGDTAVVKSETVPAEREDAVREAAEACPTEAILLEE